MKQLAAKFVALAVGSVAGGLARYHVSNLTHRYFGHGFPYGTLAVNLTGCFIIGLLSAVTEEKFFLGHHGRLILIAGFCGAFTTFSAFMLETDALLRHADFFRAFLNVLLSVSAGFVFFRLGAFLGTAFSS